MRKILIVSIMGAFAVVLALSYGLYSLYLHELKDVEDVCDEAFQQAIDGEFAFRESGSPINLKNPEHIVKFADEMTPEERASLKGDTIEITEAMKKNLGANLFDYLQQRTQDRLMDTNPLNLHNLDSLYGWYLQKAGLEIPYRLYLYNNNKEVAVLFRPCKDGNEAHRDARADVCAGGSRRADERTGAAVAVCAATVYGGFGRRLHVFQPRPAGHPGTAGIHLSSAARFEGAAERGVCRAGQYDFL